MMKYVSFYNRSNWRLPFRFGLCRSYVCEHVLAEFGNKDELCLARALIVARPKIDNDFQYKYIADYRKLMQTRLARELHQKASVPLGPCGLD